MQIEPLGFAPPLPIAPNMYFVYHSFGILPLLLDTILVVAATVVAVTITVGEHRGKMQRGMIVLCVVLALSALLIVTFGDVTSVYL